MGFLGEQGLGGWFFPRPGVFSELTFAFGSCHEPFVRAADGRLVSHAGAGIYPAMLRICRSGGTRFVVLMGDQLYSDGVPFMHLREDLLEIERAVSDNELVALYRGLYRGTLMSRVSARSSRHFLRT